MRKFTGILVIVIMMCSFTSSFAMTTAEFDAGMSKGISYFQQGLFYEARDEFGWFKARYEEMNVGQQKYLDEYIYATKYNLEEYNKSLLLGWWYQKNDMDIHSVNIVFNGDGTCYLKTWRTEEYGTYTVSEDGRVITINDVFFKYAGSATYTYFHQAATVYELSNGKLNRLYELTGNEDFNLYMDSFEHRSSFTNVPGQI